LPSFFIDPDPLVALLNSWANYDAGFISGTGGSLTSVRFPPT
jgi:hypothetical protein